jgi:hypothetical protein
MKFKSKFVEDKGSDSLTFSGIGRNHEDLSWNL